MPLWKSCSKRICYNRSYTSAHAIRLAKNNNKCSRCFTLIKINNGIFLSFFSLSIGIHITTNSSFRLLLVTKNHSLARFPSFRRIPCLESRFFIWQKAFVRFLEFLRFSRQSIDFPWLHDECSRLLVGYILGILICEGGERSLQHLNTIFKSTYAASLIHEKHQSQQWNDAFIVIIKSGMNKFEQQNPIFQAVMYQIKVLECVSIEFELV